MPMACRRDLNSAHRAEVAAQPKLWTTAAPFTGGTTCKAVLARWQDLLFGVRQDINVRVLQETFLGSNLQIAMLAHARCDFAAARPTSFVTCEGIRDALRKERSTVELEQVLLHHPAHQIGNFDLVHPVAELALEPVAIEQREKELEVLFLAIVRRGGHQEEMTRESRKKLAEPIPLRVLHLAS